MYCSGLAGSGHKGCEKDRKATPLKPAATELKPVAPVDIPDFIPLTKISQRFSVGHPPAKVFSLFEDIAAVAACLPGALISGAPRPERVEGAIKVKIGPISANFNGAARVERNEADLSGRIVGIGSDQRSRSTTQGEIRYWLMPENNDATTRVELAIGYSLTGMLAQVARTGLVRDLATRLVEEFAANLDRRLSGDTTIGSEKVAELNGVSLVFGLLRDRAARLLRRFNGRREPT